MSAGSGIVHSEKNASATEPVNFLQIWVFPKEKNIEPRYDQKLFKQEDRINQLQTVVSPEKSSNTLWINQNAWFSLSHLGKGTGIDYKLHDPSNGVYVFVIDGEVSAGGQEMKKRDGTGIWETDAVRIESHEEAEILLMEVPMHG